MWSNYCQEKISKKAILVLPVLDWDYLAIEANAGSLFKCKWRWSLQPPFQVIVPVQYHENECGLLNCASLLRKTPVSYARAKDSVHTTLGDVRPSHYAWDETNVRFLLNQHGDVPLLLPSDGLKDEFKHHITWLQYNAIYSKVTNSGLR